MFLPRYSAVLKKRKDALRWYDMAMKRKCRFEKRHEGIT
jgi:hypothetical protein